MELKTGYKQTEVGVIPENWSAEPLGKHASFRTGPFGSALHKSDYINDGIPVINPMHIVDGQIVSSADMTITESAAQSLVDFRLRAGEIVIGRRGDMGRCAVVKPHQAGWLCGTGSMIVKPTDFDPQFLQRVLSSPQAITAIVNSSVGTTMVNLNQGSLSSLKVQYPPLLEQSAIANVLNDVDELLVAQDMLINKKRAIKQGAMQELLTGKRRLSGFGGKWEVKRLSDLCSLKSGETITATHIDECSVFPCYGGNGLRGFTKSYTHEGDYALIGRQGALCGNVVSASGKFFASEHALVVTPKVTTDIHWLSHVLRRANLNQYSESSAQPGLSASKLLLLDFLVPPMKEEQTAIAQVLAGIDAEISALEGKREKTALLKKGMMQELLTGRTRLV